ncbi:MAG: hypothetical protein Q4Q23_00375 [Methanobacteriaceae archaeon]|nr:hypothetical protein [Methanobacteriaceae archaeon]
MLMEEANEAKLKQFKNIEQNIKKSLNECESMYSKLSKYNDLITYEELYNLTDEDNEKFIIIRDETHKKEDMILEIKEELISLLELDIEWNITNKKDNSEFEDMEEYIKNSDIYYNYFQLEIMIGLLFDKLKQLNIPRNIPIKHELHHHSHGGCC